MNVTVNGALGRMGREVIVQVLEAEGLDIVSLWESPSHPGVGNVEPLTGLSVLPQWEGPIGTVIIDFSVREGLASLLAGAGDNVFALVSGTTGLTEDDGKALATLSERAPVFHAANMSVGIHILRNLAARAAQMTRGKWDMEIVEMHHNRKEDAPSGTALALAETLAGAVDVELTQVAGRDGLIGPRKRGELGVLALRGGDVVGEHDVIFAGPGEVLRLRHQALARAVFAAGACAAAEWVVGQPPGLYSMNDLIPVE